MRIGVLTGGGDVPGLNRCIKSVVERVAQDGHDVVGIRRGWAGLLDYDLADPAGSTARTLQLLDREAVRTIDRTGGTILHTSRLDPAAIVRDRVPRHLVGDLLGQGPFDLTKHVLAVVEHLELDALVPIGGADTLGYAARLADEGVPVVAIPKTMDNDVLGTDYCLGFSTAVTRSVELLHQLRTSAGSHERIAVVELFGRYSGETSLIAAYLASVDRAVISEVPFEPEHLAALLMEDRRRNPSRYAMVTMSEGASFVGGEPQRPESRDADGHPRAGGIGARTAEVMRELTGQEIVAQSLGYLMRSGRPDSLDLMVATNYAVMAADLVVDDADGRLVALREGTYTDVPLAEVRGGRKHVDVDALYDRQAYRPKLHHVTGKPMFLY